MELKVDNDAIAQAVNDAAQEAVTDAIGSYDVKKTLEQAIAAGFSGSEIPTAVAAAVAAIDNTALVQSLAREMEKATTSAVVMLIQEGLVGVIARIRGIGTYDTGRKEALNKIRAELRTARARTEDTNDQG